MKNHFFMAYSGNKRNEVEGLYNEVKDKLNDIDIIIEPFCGSSAFSYYLSLKHPKKFEYVLNDNNHHLLTIYDIMTNPKELDELISKLNDFSKGINKEKYYSICKEDKHENWLYKNKVHSLRPGLFPLGKIKTDFSDMKNAPIINFLKTEKIKFYNEEGVDIVEHYKDNKRALIFLDPPYLVSCNDFYYDSQVNIYEYLHNNPIDKMKAAVLLCLEDNWIIKLLFHSFIKSSYAKKYELSKKQTTHLIIANF